MVTLQRALERIHRSRRTVAPTLLVPIASTTKSHQPIRFIFFLISAPDPPCYDEQACDDNSATYSDHDANDRVLCFRAQARGL
jgi:hypothetical protein